MYDWKSYSAYTLRLLASHKATLPFSEEVIWKKAISTNLGCLHWCVLVAWRQKGGTSEKT